nr:hypothetical protein [Tanacetum cinerariifolium]
MRELLYHLLERNPSPPQAPSKSISSKSTHYTSSLSPSESLILTHVAHPPKLCFVILIKQEPQELPPLQISPNDPYAQTIDNWPPGLSNPSPPLRVTRPPLAKEWPLHQLDINNAFLHGHIDEEIYMLPPEGYHKALPGQVCIELCRTKHGTHLNQRKYILDLLSDAGLTGSKPAAFPLPTRLKLSLDKGIPLVDEGSYRRLVDIPRRPNEPTIVDFQMKYLRRDCGNSNVQDMRIPDELLAYADQTALCVIEYRNSSPPMIQLEPKGSTHGATLGSCSDRDGTRGDPKRTQGENIQLYSRRKKGDDIQSYIDSDDADNQDSRLNRTDTAKEDSNNEGGFENDERSSEESENLLQTNSDKWVNASTNGLHLLISSIEQDFMNPVTQAIIPPSHSVSSQQDPVSIAYRELANNLLHSHSENANIEKGGHLLSSPASLSAQSSLEPSKTMSRILESNKSLRDFAGTSVVVPHVGISRGSGENPTSVGVNIGHGVESTVVATEPLSGPEEAILPPPPPPRSQQDLSVDELKQLLLAKLLSQSEDESADADLIMILRKQSQVSQNSATKEDAMNSTKSINATLEKLSARLAAHINLMRHIMPIQLEILLLSKEYPQMNMIRNLLPGIIETILCSLPIEEAVRTSILLGNGGTSDGAESSDGERMFDQPSKKKKLKQLAERRKFFHAICYILSVARRAKEDHLCWQKWDSDCCSCGLSWKKEKCKLQVIAVVSLWFAE